MTAERASPDVNRCALHALEMLTMTTLYRPIFDPLEFDTFGCHPF